MKIVSRSSFFVLVNLFVLTAGFLAQTAFAQEPAEARAIVSCGSDDDPERVEKALTGFFGKDDTNVFNLDCDHSEIFGVATIQELVTVLAISGPAAQTQAEVVVTVQIAPIPDCPSGGKGSGSGHTAAGSVIELSIAIKTRQPPPITLDTIPGIAIVKGAVSAEVKPPGETPVGENNRALAAIGFLDGVGQALGAWQVETSDGKESRNIDHEISLDMITTGEDMRFSKGSVVEAELYALEPCEGGESSSNAFAFMDPVFDFDQERFDAEQGANSFLLDEYFEILVSPNLNQLLFKDNFED
jgi:hypothetical protein